MAKSSQPFVFICHVSADKPRIGPIIEELIKSDIDVFVDKVSGFGPAVYDYFHDGKVHCLDPTEGPYPTQIHAAIKQCAMVLAFLTTENAPSFTGYCAGEVELARTESKVVMFIALDPEGDILSRISNDPHLVLEIRPRLAQWAEPQLLTHWVLKRLQSQAATSLAGRIRRLAALREEASSLHFGGPQPPTPSEMIAGEKCEFMFVPSAVSDGDAVIFCSTMPLGGGREWSAAEVAALTVVLPQDVRLPTAAELAWATNPDNVAADGGANPFGVQAPNPERMAWTREMVEEAVFSSDGKRGILFLVRD